VLILFKSVLDTEISPWRGGDFEKEQTDKATRFNFDRIALFYYQAELIILFTSFSSSSFSIGYQINKFLSIALYSLFLNSS
jgi:hypothetical protein